MEKLEEIKFAMESISKARENNDTYYGPNEEDIVWLLADVAQSLRIIAQVKKPDWE